LVEDDGSVWTNGAMPSAFWSRYLEVFDRVSVAGRLGGAKMQRLARSDRVAVEFHLLSNLNGVRQSFARPAARAELDRLVSASDAVVARLPSELGLMASGLAMKRSKPLLVEVVGCAWEAFRNHGSLIGKLYAPLAYLRNRRAVGQADFVTYVTQDWLQRRYPSPNPQLADIPADYAGGLQAGIADAEICLPIASTRAARRIRVDEVLAGRPLVFGTIGTLMAKYKGLHVALAAMAELSAEGRTFTYRILGMGDPTALRRRIAEAGLEGICIVDPPAPPGDDVLAWLDRIDVHVQPSLTEALGRGTIEAMSRGAACVGSATGGLLEYLNPDFLHRPGDSRGLARDLRRLMDDRSVVAALSAEAFTRVERFGPQIRTDRLNAMLNALARAAALR
jgi:glycosyltransferase involved in cell wall biosynthesis